MSEDKDIPSMDASEHCGGVMAQIGERGELPTTHMSNTDLSCSPAKLTQNLESLLDQLGQGLASRKLKIATAESCTGGLLSFALASDPAVSPNLDRGFIVYSPDAKSEQLGLSLSQIDRCDGVSAAVAKAMADSALVKSQADIAVAVTGFAGPQEESEEVGLVYLAVAMRGKKTFLRTCRFGDVGRLSVCQQAAEEALEMLVSATQQN